MQKHFLIVGGGLAGSFLAVSLAKKGHKVTLHEARADLRKFPPDAGRSFNLTLYKRGLAALQKLGVWDEVKKVTMRVDGNVCHPPFASEYFDPYEKTGKEVLYTVHRKELNATLLTIAQRMKNVKIVFDSKCVSIDRTAKTALFLDAKTGKIRQAKADAVIGADGAHSVIRSEIQRGQQADFKMEYLDWGYKEVPLTKDMADSLLLRPHATHTWPRDHSLFIAFPNHDKTFTLMVNLPLRGTDSFETLTNAEKIHSFITQNFPPLIPATDVITDAVLNRPLGNFITIYTTPWQYEGFLLMLGDAAHGVNPFYGQGMCAAFEDCLVLTTLIQKYPSNLKRVFAEFEALRKPNTDVLADISKENFVELRDKARSSYYTLKAKTYTFLHQLFPKLWSPPLYKMVAHDTLSYKDANMRYRKQEWIARIIGLHILLGLVSLPYSLFHKAGKGQ
jgi:kynurenine 3-monooxygenase